jgi:uncharacterized surface protein with fasciclin (FAS1) repeats
MENNKMIIIGVVAFVIIAAFVALSRDTTPNNEMTDTPEQITEENVMENEEELNEEVPSESEQTIVDIAAGNDNFKTLVAAVQAAGLTDTLSGDGPFTVLAPTDAAFTKLPAGTVESLIQDKEALTKVLTYHVLPGKIMAEDIVNLTSATTVQGQDVTIKVEGGKVMINNANVVTTDIEASNGVIHVIDTVLLPE